jgi:hypothetical protein
MGLGDPQSAESRRRETLFSGAGRSVSAPLPQSVPADLFQRVDPWRGASITSGCASPPAPRSHCRSQNLQCRNLSAGACDDPAPSATPVPEPVMAPPPRMAPDPRPPPRTMPTCSRRKARSRWRKIKTSL